MEPRSREPSPFATPFEEEPTRPAHVPTSERLLGSILMRECGLRRDQLEAGLATQRQEGGRIGEILVKLHAINEGDLLRALGIQLEIPVAAEIKPDEVDVDLATQVPIAFAREHKLLVLKRGEVAIQVALVDPLDLFALDDLRRLLGAQLEPLLVPDSVVSEAINKVYAKKTSDADLGGGEGDEEFGEAEELTDILDMTDEAPIIRWVNSLLFNAVKERASDIHVEPGEKEVRVRYRVDGDLREAKRANKQYMASIIARVKIMAGLNIAEKRLPQDGRIRRKIAGKDIDMRVATAPAATGGEHITIRLLDRQSILLDLADVGFGEDHLAAMSELIERPHGILLVTGPTGSGKTTTLYACLARINRPDQNILTVEDPVEYQLEGITQVQVNPKIELTFANALRSFLRHDPDVILVGEIRDLETAEIAIQASLTGHLVFSTVHTNDAAGGITRLVDMGVQPFLVASSLVGLLAQRLIRRVCPDCRETYRPSAAELAQMGVDPDQFFAGRARVQKLKAADHPPPPGMVYRARGCSKCQGTGYRGRLGIYELLMIDDEIRQLTLKNTESNTIKRAAVDKGMRTLRDDGAQKVLAGASTIEEVMMVTTEE
ncbi:MAG TPA: type II secretion system ATPase GspE [Polyangia bacterium]|nr:type II secretion system ATPase GspE [Polyangia bacterium]